MLKLVIPDQVVALGALPAARTTEDEENMRLRQLVGAMQLFLSRKRHTCEEMQPMSYIKLK